MIDQGNLTQGNCPPSVRKGLGRDTVLQLGTQNLRSCLIWKWMPERGGRWIVPRTAEVLFDEIVMMMTEKRMDVLIMTECGVGARTDVGEEKDEESRRRKKLRSMVEKKTRGAFSVVTASNGKVAVMMRKTIAQMMCVETCNERMVTMRGVVRGRRVKVVGLYAEASQPNSSRGNDENRRFWKDAQTTCQMKTGNECVIAGGDMNDWLCEKDGGQEGGKGWMKEYLIRGAGMRDIYRFGRPEGREMTWKRDSETGTVERRLDYFLASEKCVKQGVVGKAMIEWYPWSSFKADHAMVTCELKVRDEDRLMLKSPVLMAIRGWKEKEKERLKEELKTVVGEGDVLKQLVGKAMKVGRVRKKERREGREWQRRSRTIEAVRMRGCLDEEWLNAEEKFLGEELIREAVLICKEADVVEERWRRWMKKAQGRWKKNYIEERVRMREERARLNDWRYVWKSLNAGTNAPFVSTVSVGGERLTRTDEVTAALSDHFEKVWGGAEPRSDEHDVTELEQLVQQDEREMYDIPDEVVLNDVEKVIEKICRGKATSDGVGKEGLELMTKEMKEELVKECNEVLKGGKIPMSWKECVTMAFEKEEGMDAVEKTRPITIGATGMRVIEGLLKETATKMTGAAEWEQHGFRQGLSTDTARMVVVEYCGRRLAEKKSTWVCSIDLEKAFDRVPKSTLSACARTSKRGKKVIMNLMKACWTRVEVRGYRGRKIWMRLGTRQGSVLSPALFLCVMDVVIREVRKAAGGRGVCVAFADDLQLLADDERTLEKMMKAAKRAIRICGMRMNVKKTKVMKVGRKVRERRNVIMDGDEYEMCKEIKILGQIVDEKLTGERQLSESCDKGKTLGRWIGMKRVSNEILKLVLDVKIRPSMCYGVRWSALQRDGSEGLLRKSNQRMTGALMMGARERWWVPEAPTVWLCEMMNMRSVREELLLRRLRVCMIVLNAGEGMHKEVLKQAVVEDMEGWKGPVWEVVNELHKVGVRIEEMKRRRDDELIRNCEDSREMWRWSVEMMSEGEKRMKRALERVRVENIEVIKGWPKDSGEVGDKCVYTDGSWDKEGLDAGCGIWDGERGWIAKVDDKMTYGYDNNTAELLAIVCAFMKWRRCNLTVATDSQVCIDWIEGRKAIGDGANGTLVHIARAWYDHDRHKLHKVKGHGSAEETHAVGNAIADRLALIGRRRCEDGFDWRRGEVGCEIWALMYGDRVMMESPKRFIEYSERERRWEELCLKADGNGECWTDEKEMDRKKEGDLRYEVRWTKVDDRWRPRAWPEPKGDMRRLMRRGVWRLREGEMEPIRMEEEMRKYYGVTYARMGARNEREQQALWRKMMSNAWKMMRLLEDSEVSWLLKWMTRWIWARGSLGGVGRTEEMEDELAEAIWTGETSPDTTAYFKVPRVWRWLENPDGDDMEMMVMMVKTAHRLWKEIVRPKLKAMDEAQKDEIEKLKKKEDAEKRANEKLLKQLRRDEKEKLEMEKAEKERARSEARLRAELASRLVKNFD